jgi:hypothetical protein
MQDFLKLIDLLIISCGLEFLIALFAIEILVTLVALFLLFVIRQQHAFVIFLPVTLFPMFIGSLRSLMTLSTVFGVLTKTDANSAGQHDGIVLLAMSAAPVLFGIVVSMPAFFVVVLGRATMVLKANWKPGAKQRSDDTVGSSSQDDFLTSTTDAYLAELTRKRR